MLPGTPRSYYVYAERLCQSEFAHPEASRYMLFPDLEVDMSTDYKYHWRETGL